MDIIKKIVPEDKYDTKCPFAMNPTRIVVHNTYNDASAENEAAYMTNNNLEKSTHYFVDDTQAIQCIEENRNSWNAGDGHGKGNLEGISVEICYSKSGGDRFIKSEQNGAELVAQILKRHGWGLDKVTKHQDYSGKYCPHRTLDMGWQRFLNMVSACLNGTEFPALEPEEENASRLGVASVTCSTLNMRSGPGTNYSIIRTLHQGNLFDLLEDCGNGWLKINVVGTVGYVAAAYTSCGGSKPVEAPTETPKVGYCTTTLLNVRSGAGTGYDRVFQIANGNEVNILSDCGNGWYYIECLHGKGYCSAEYISTNAPAETKAKTLIVTGELVNVRSGPGTNNSVVFQVAAGNSLNILGYQNGWYNINCLHGDGWIIDNYVVEN